MVSREGVYPRDGLDQLVAVSCWAMLSYAGLS